jgi:hypothetical protein
MPLPRKRDAGGSGAPVLDLLNAHVRLVDVEEHVEPYTITRKSDGQGWTKDPDFSCTVEIIDDGQGGKEDGTKFFESFKYKEDKDPKTGKKLGTWGNQKNSKLGALTEVVKPGYFDDASIPELSEDDLEGFEMMCRIKPRKNPTSGAIVGSTIDYETMRPLPTKTKAAATTGEPVRGDTEFEENWDDIPF